MQFSIPPPIPPNTTHLPSLKLALICGGTGAEHIGSIESALWLLSQFRRDHQLGFFYQYLIRELAIITASDKRTSPETSAKQSQPHQ
ncbi:hypothetical protein SAMN05216333_104104 [Nitrosomonas oligotropha]|uniref:Uncharacterized protein n=1 Tax=Nitrosomonas oligotropha TaxID=42354 RepID=A0A1H8LYS8_9PROT|nr:hypothetical protein SAMN05216300_10436 [Nitrosomonas oligotropha]SEO10241.1 hypothetical protein SAMN05216333_104104 [Nitrosomonas oligotropha]